MKCIVNLSTEKYAKGAARLYDSLQGRYDGDILMFRDEAEVGSMPHHDNPYAFKVYAFYKAMKMGYKQILWLDASCYAVRPVQPIFDWIDEKGFFMEAAGHWTGTWANDYCLQYFGITREQAMQMPMFAAGYFGLNFDNEQANIFFTEWSRAMCAGAFKGDWSNHRHDMTCGSIIAYKMGLDKQYSEGGQYFAYIGDAYGNPKDSTIFHLAGAT